MVLILKVWVVSHIMLQIGCEGIVSTLSPFWGNFLLWPKKGVNLPIKIKPSPKLQHSTDFVLLVYYSSWGASLLHASNQGKCPSTTCTLSLCLGFAADHEERTDSFCWGGIGYQHVGTLSMHLRFPSFAFSPPSIIPTFSCQLLFFIVFFFLSIVQEISYSCIVCIVHYALYGCIGKWKAGLKQ